MSTDGAMLCQPGVCASRISRGTRRTAFFKLVVATLRVISMSLDGAGDSGVVPALAVELESDWREPWEHLNVVVVFMASGRTLTMARCASFSQRTSSLAGQRTEV